jgi:hypothetical protein
MCYLNSLCRKNVFLSTTLWVLRNVPFVLGLLAVRPSTILRSKGGFESGKARFGAGVETLDPCSRGLVGSSWWGCSCPLRGCFRSLIVLCG